MRALADRYGLTERQQSQFSALLSELAADELAPTTVREPSQATNVHLADSLVALEVQAVGTARTIADMGAGAGFPGLALAVALPRSEVALLESQARKCAFMQRMCTAVGVENAHVVGARVEEWHEGTGANDVVVARALAAQPVVLEYAAPLLRMGGTLVDWRGRRDAQEEAAASAAAAELGLCLAEIRRVKPYAGVRDHHLHIYAKEQPTPPRFPRRAGIARKRPLGGRAASGTAPRADPDRR